MTSPAPIIPPHRTPAARAEKYIPAAVQLLAAICFVGVTALIITAWPFKFAETPWRVQMFATGLAAVPQLTLLLTLIAVAGVYAGMHRAVRVSAISMFVLSGILIILVPLFALDFMTQRHVQAQSSLAAYTREGIRLGISSAFLVPFMIWAGLKAWVAGKPDPTDEEHGVPTSGLVVGQSN